MQLTETAAWLLAKGLVQAPVVSQPDPEAGPEVAPEDDLERCEEQPLVWMNGMSGRPSGPAADDIMYK